MAHIEKQAWEIITQLSNLQQYQIALKILQGLETDDTEWKEMIRTKADEIESGKIKSIPSAEVFERALKVIFTDINN